MPRRPLPAAAPRACRRRIRPLDAGTGRRSRCQQPASQVFVAGRPPRFSSTSAASRLLGRSHGLATPRAMLLAADPRPPERPTCTADDGARTSPPSPRQRPTVVDYGSVRASMSAGRALQRRAAFRPFSSTAASIGPDDLRSLGAALGDPAMPRSSPLAEPTLAEVDATLAASEARRRASPRPRRRRPPSGGPGRQPRSPPAPRRNVVPRRMP